jgi:LPXTG-site transpeptidase (sortase) family protein
MDHDKNSAARIIRQKIDSLYDENEPNVQEEIEEAETSSTKSKHQKFIDDLIQKGASVEVIQTEWHNYYFRLSEKEKKQVWDEFYKSNKNIKKPDHINSFEMQMSAQKNEVAGSGQFDTKRRRPTILSGIQSKVNANGKLKLKHHLQSLLFGLTMGFVVIFIFMFGFFNEILIAPLIQPSRNVTAVPIIVGADNFTATSQDQVIIPKINVQIPVNYNIATTNENTIENFLQDGVVHYPTTVDPGQIGNAAFFGHSSNNIFNPGKYKFAFVLLHTLVDGDTFYLTYNKTLYVYKVIKTEIVNPSDVSVLNPVNGQSATATLITCDPPGTSINRLVVIGEQISPSISTDTTSSLNVNPTSGTNYLPGNGPTLWSRFINSAYGKVILIGVGLILVYIVYRRFIRARD